MKNLSQKGSSLIAILFIVGVIILVTIIFFHQKNNSQKNIPPINNEQIVQGKQFESSTSNNVRYSYDFQKLLSSFEKISIEKYSIEIGIPQEIKFTIVNKEHIDSDLLSQYALFMESQDSTGTEIFDGMLVNINIYPMNQQNINKTYEKPLDQEQEKLYKNENITYKERITIGNNTYTLINECCYGGVTKIYYLSNDSYIYEIETFTTGPDEQNFDKIIHKILEQIRINSP